MTTIEIDNRTITTRKAGETNVEAFERTIERIYGANTWFRPNDGRITDGYAWRGYGHIYRSLGDGSSTCISNGQIWVEVGAE